jgi:integrase
MTARALDSREAEGILRSLRKAQWVRFAAQAKMSDDAGVARRSYGSGSLFTKHGNWYGKWRVGGQQVKRMLGPARKPGTKEGLTRSQAEKALRRKMEAETPSAPATARFTIEDGGTRLIAHLKALGRKASTIEGYESALRVHLAPYFGDLPLDRVDPDDIEAFIAHERRAGRLIWTGQGKQRVAKRVGSSPKSVCNYVGFLHSIFDSAIRRGWASDNPCKHVEKPTVEDSDEIRFLDQTELEALLRASPAADDFLWTLWDTDRTLYLVAAMTGLRMGELLALRWRDVDWTAGRIRVRQSYVRGETGTPKTRRGSRSVPMADRVARELELHFQRSVYQGDDDLVFAHPEVGGHLDRSKVRKRLKKAIKRAKVRDVRFHDLRHTFGTRCAAAGVAMRTLQEWMGHREFKTTLRYADYAPDPGEAQLVERAFGAGTNSGTNLSEPQGHSTRPKPL